MIKQNKFKLEKTTEQIKEDLNKARERCDSVVLVGGEPTIRKDIIEIVKYAKQLGFKKIQIQTNGRRFAYKNFCIKKGWQRNEIPIELNP